MEQQPAHVLLVEDNPGDADLVRLRLVESKSDVFVNCVPRLSDALACLDAETPSLVLLDLNLPDSHGGETILRTLLHSTTIPLVVLTGNRDQHVSTNALQKGVCAYLVKGMDAMDRLARTLHEAVSQRRRSSALDAERDEAT